MSNRKAKLIMAITTIIFVVVVVFALLVGNTQSESEHPRFLVLSNSIYPIIEIDTETGGRFQAPDSIYRIKDEVREELNQIKDQIDPLIIEELSDKYFDAEIRNGIERREIWVLGFSDERLTSDDFYTKEERIAKIQEEENERWTLKEPVDKEELLANITGSLDAENLQAISEQEYAAVVSDGKDFLETLVLENEQISYEGDCFTITNSKGAAKEWCSPPEGVFGEHYDYLGYSEEINRHVTFFSIEESWWSLFDQETQEIVNFDGANPTLLTDDNTIIAFLGNYASAAGYNKPGIWFIDGGNSVEIGGFTSGFGGLWAVTDAKSNGLDIYFEVTGLTDISTQETVSTYFKYSLENNE